MINLKELREEKGLSLRKLERETGISVRTLSLLERGKIKYPRKDTLDIIEKFFQLPEGSAYSSIYSQREKNRELDELRELRARIEKLEAVCFADRQ